jgi:hypothetical protein
MFQSGQILCRFEFNRSFKMTVRSLKYVACHDSKREQLQVKVIERNLYTHLRALMCTLRVPYEAFRAVAEAPRPVGKGHSV